MTFIFFNIFFKIGGVILLLIALLFVIHLLARRFGWRPEWQRKTLHVAVGSSALGFPWLFDRPWQVAMVCTLGALIMLALRTVPRLRQSLGRCVHDVKRSSLGELLLVLSIVVLFWLTDGQGLHYVLPLAILTFADASAALVGMSYGKHRFAVIDGTKSGEGVATFAALAFCLSLSMLALLSELPWQTLLLLALSVTYLSTLIETVSWRGLDNLLIPLGVYLCLERLLEQSAGYLFEQGLLLGALLAVALLCHSRFTIHGRMFGVLMLSCLLIGGNLLWMAALLSLFFCHHILNSVWEDAPLSFREGCVNPQPINIW